MVLYKKCCWGEIIYVWLSLPWLPIVLPFDISLLIGAPVVEKGKNQTKQNENQAQHETDRAQRAPLITALTTFEKFRSGGTKSHQKEILR